MNNNTWRRKIYSSDVHRQSLLRRKKIDIFQDEKEKKLREARLRKYQEFLHEYMSMTRKSFVLRLHKNILLKRNLGWHLSIIDSIKVYNSSLHEARGEFLGCLNLLHLRSGVFIKAIKQRHKHQPRGFIFIESFKVSCIHAFLPARNPNLSPAFLGSHLCIKRLWKRCKFVGTL